MSAPDANAGEYQIEELNYFRFRRLDDSILLTNDSGYYELLTPEEFESFVHGTLPEDHPKRKALLEKDFYRNNLSNAVDRFGRKNHFVFKGTSLHIAVVTQRCDHQCQYCHSSIVGPNRVEGDMADEVCDKVVERIFQSPSPSLTIEFQGGEPLLAWPKIRRIIDRAEEKNKLAGKEILYSIVSNLVNLSDEMIEEIVRSRIQICTSMDGPAVVHDANRPYRKGVSGHALVLEKIAQLKRAFADQGWDPKIYQVGCIFTTTQNSFGHEREIIDQYVDLGLHNIHLRQLDPLGYAVKNDSTLGYSYEDYKEFYFNTLEYILELNRKGVEFAEITASLHLKKILTDTDPNYVDLRSPCGATIGQIAYDFDGRVYTCDEGRMLAAMGDDRFMVGTVRDDWASYIKHEATRATIVASTLDGVPGCAECAYKPFCGICPVQNIRTHGSIHGIQLASEYCQHHMDVQDWIFRKLRDEPDTRTLFEHWVEERPQVEWIHKP